MGTQLVDDIDITQPSPPPIGCSRTIDLSLPSEYELDSVRKSSPPVALRRQALRTYVACAVGVAWYICLFAIGETALRSLMHP